MVLRLFIGRRFFFNFFQFFLRTLKEGRKEDSHRLKSFVFLFFSCEVKRVRIYIYWISSCLIIFCNINLLLAYVKSSWIKPFLFFFLVC